MTKKRSILEKIKDDYYYNLFDVLYDENTVIIGNTWLKRIQSKNYTWVSLKPLCEALVWFYSCVLPENPCLKINPRYIGRTFVCDINEGEIRLEMYSFDKCGNRYIPKWKELEHTYVPKEERFEWCLKAKAYEDKLGIPCLHEVKEK